MAIVSILVKFGKNNGILYMNYYGYIVEIREDSYLERKREKDEAASCCCS